jgi:hypothetical protein
MKYNRQLMQASIWDRLNIAGIVGVQVSRPRRGAQGLRRIRCVDPPATG